jgi:hypothetical protein
MSVNEVKSSPRKLSLEKFNKWIEENKISNTCPFCQTNDWSVPVDTGILGCALPWGDGCGEMYMTGLPILPLTCKKCFFVRPIVLSNSLVSLVTEDPEDAAGI